MTEVEKYEGLIAKLTRAREACVQRGTELADERAAIALEAHTGNTKSAKRLMEINAALAVHGSELASLDAAAKAAAEKLAAAQRAEARSAERETAAELKAAVAELRVAGQTLDDALVVLVGAGGELHKAIDKIHSLGCSHPHHQQVLSLGERALVTALQQTIWARAFHVLAPREQTRFADFISQWERMLQNEIARRLGEPQPQKEEAA